MTSPSALVGSLVRVVSGILWSTSTDGNVTEISIDPQNDVVLVVGASKMPWSGSNCRCCSTVLHRGGIFVTALRDLEVVQSRAGTV